VACTILQDRCTVPPSLDFPRDFRTSSAAGPQRKVKSTCQLRAPLATISTERPWARVAGTATTRIQKRRQRIRMMSGARMAKRDAPIPPLTGFFKAPLSFGNANRQVSKRWVRGRQGGGGSFAKRNEQKSARMRTRSTSRIYQGIKPRGEARARGSRAAIQFTLSDPPARRTVVSSVLAESILSCR
jgi:hypothetical protein